VYPQVNDLSDTCTLDSSLVPKLDEIKEKLGLVCAGSITAVTNGTTTTTTTGTSSSTQPAKSSSSHGMTANAPLVAVAAAAAVAAGFML
jgi:hypothetical protein